MEEREFIVEGKPVGKARPRFCRGTVYTPQPTREFERTVRRSYFAKYAGKKPLSGEVEAVINVY